MFKPFTSSMFKVFVTRQIPENGIRILRDAGLDVEIWPQNNPIGKDELISKVREAHALVTMNSDLIDEEILEEGKHLKIIANFLQGHDNLDIMAASKRGIALTYTPDVVTDAKAEMLIALMMSLARHIPIAHQYVQDGLYKRWEPLLFRGMQLRGKTLGFIGMSQVAMRAAEIAVHGLGMKVVFYDEEKKKMPVKAHQLSLEQVLAESDAISLHMPALPTTTKFISNEEFRMMKDGALLINTSRGVLVDESALVQNIRCGKVGGAALDVLKCEMLQMCEPADHAELKKLDNVILTPQIATATHEARNAMSEAIANDIILVASGKEPKHMINPEIYDPAYE